MLEKEAKKRIKKIVKEKIENWAKDFLTDWNTLDNKLVEKTEKFLNDWEENNVKTFKIYIFENQGKICYCVFFREFGKTIFTIDITKKQLFEILN